ncbi:MFS family permease [Kitasatospora sp. GAS204A]|uniref:MFS transporter n=1 Tax=unclassified Kitasatospora TaxID=2633591 RepID=UPI002475D14A|nr:MFS transporter [Kitasatospora sp. GAS204B]MDH6118401.1 MFS family permease [Kitasatospora sp. GAS204B]
MAQDSARPDLLSTPDPVPPLPPLLPSAARPGPRPALLTACYGTFLVLIAYTLPTTTLAPTASALHAGPAAQTWILTGALLGLTALLLIMGGVADDHGRKRVFTAGALLLAASAALSALAPDTTVFVIARVLQGGASAALLAPSLGLVSQAYPAGPARVRALGGWGAAVGLGIAVGPVYAALLAELAGWRAVYAVLAALALLLAGLAARHLTESRSDRPRRLDPLGALTLSVGTAALIAGLAEGRTGWLRPAPVTLLALGVLALGAFALVESRVAEPMLDLALFRDARFVAAGTGALFTGLSIVGLMSCLPSVLERALGESPLVAGLVLAIWSGLSVVAALQSRRLADRLAPVTQLAAALLACAVGEAALYGLTPAAGWPRLVPGLVVAGLGSGVLNAALARLAVSSVPGHRAAMGSGANNTARYLGSALGVALSLALIGSARSPAGPAAAAAAGADRAIVVAVALCLLGAAVALWARAAARAAARSGACSGAREGAQRR